jgi:hypothetical protein
MPFGNVLEREFTAKVTSVRISELGGGRRRTEIDSTGAAKGQVPGQVFGTMVIEGVPGHTATYTSAGTILAASGAVVRVSGQGVCIRTGEGHKIRCRGTGCLATDDPKLAALNGLLAAAEFEIDPAAMTITGTIYEWK